MKLFFDFFPLLVFFIVYKIWGIYYATGAIIIASTIQIAYLWFRYKRFELMHIITFVLLVIFGGLTIILHDAEFLKWKVSIVNWLFGAGFLASQLFMKKTIIEYLMDKNLTLPKKVWNRLNLLWCLFFFILGTINLWVLHYFSTAVWVNFKVFGLLGLTAVFVVIQTLYLIRHVKHTPQSSNNS